jgi:ABC-type multidrug transport system fused ATPase/permease subunit
MEFNVEERGSNMSQGQRQRIGIARALFSNPKILVLDEATSSQDRETEDSISGLVHELKGRTTVIMIAHRLELVTKADLVLFVNNGQIEASGTFQEVRAKSRRFDLLASLNGL